MKRKNLFNGMILAFSVIFIRFIDVRVYDMPLILTLVLLMVLIYGGIRLVERFPALDEPVSKRTSLITNTLVIVTIFLAFFVLGL
ncbi:hypothetical protein [Planococcus alpniumensis]|uniref:hypothetical protein n=1 Tax=Planococcus alpniumensis TaxID=2708345 RepID=UPI001B8C0180|nr:hypothetical protein [Planococcus sp. MSAK28401]